MSSIITSVGREELEVIVKESKCLMQVLNKLGLSGRGHSYDYLKKRLDLEKIPYSHMGKKRYNIKYNCISDILVENSTYQNSSQLKTKLVKNGIKQNICEKCGQLPTHNGETLSLHLDHINGIHSDNRLDNLRILCPNCHSQTQTYAGKKNKNRINNYESSVIKTECKKCGCEILSDNKYGMCKKCFDNSAEKKEILKEVNSKQQKTFIIQKEKLQEMVEKMPVTKIAEIYGVSDTAIRKRCLNLDVKIPKYPKGYWLKIMPV
jgi:5-methylcytosine-specific restriction endonuclease McrA